MSQEVYVVVGRESTPPPRIVSSSVFHGVFDSIDLAEEYCIETADEMKLRRAATGNYWEGEAGFLEILSQELNSEKYYIID